MHKGQLRSALSILSLLALAACGSGDQPAKKKAMAGGQILEASVSDAMLPLDQVRSQPPLAPKPSAAAVPGKAAAPDDAKDEAAPVEAAEPAVEAPKPDAE